MKRHMHLNLFIHSRGHHEASWRHPAASPLSLSDIRYYQALAQQAEAGLFDSIFLADQLALGDDIAHGPRTALEPITVLAALAVSTSRIGLIATASTTYTEPFNLARQFASLDHISRGRIGWNIVTSWLAPAARNYGGTAQVSHAERYARAEEFLTVVKGLWDSWAADAELDDRASGRYANPARIRPLNHEGAYYRVAGPLNLPRCPQGRPVLVQAGSSDTGRGFCGASCRGHFHGANGEDERTGLLCRSQGARRGRGAQHRSGADPARPQPVDRLKCRRSAAVGGGTERTGESRRRAQASLGPFRGA